MREEETVRTSTMLHGVSVLQEFVISSLHALGIYCLCQIFYLRLIYLIGVGLQGKPFIRLTGPGKPCVPL